MAKPHWGIWSEMLNDSACHIQMQVFLATLLPGTVIDRHVNEIQRGLMRISLSLGAKLQILAVRMQESWRSSIQMEFTTSICLIVLSIAQ